MGEQRYVTLMASLPYHGRLFGARQTPLSRFQLNKRLAWLEPDDAATLEKMEGQLRWGRQLLLEDDEGVLRKARDVIDGMENQLLADVIRHRLEIRTVIAALRKRAAGHGAPGPQEIWGYGRWLNVMRNHWAQPDFGIGHIYPWILDGHARLKNGDTVGLERLFLGMAWEFLARAGAGHYFDFEAVAVYVLRWDLIDRWTRADEQDAQERIMGLAEAGLGNYQKMYH